MLVSVLVLVLVFVLVEVVVVVAEREVKEASVERRVGHAEESWQKR